MIQLQTSSTKKKIKAVEKIKENKIVMSRAGRVTKAPFWKSIENQNICSKRSVLLAKDANVVKDKNNED